MARKKTTMAELRVGILTVATIVILIIFILSVTGDISLFKKKLTYTTRLNAAEGLKSGDEVRLAGKLVGKVDEVDFGDVPVSQNDKPIVVTMGLNAEEVRDRIRKDSRAVLAQQGFLGDRVIDITPGTRESDPLPPGAEIQSADVAGLSQVFGGASDLLVQFNAVGKQLQELMENVQKGEGTIGKLLHDDALYVNLNRTVVEFQDIAGRVGKGTGTVAKLLNDPKLYDDLRGVTNDFQGIVADVRAGKGTLGKLMTDEQFYRQANDLLAKFNSAAEKFDRITAEIEAGRGTLGKFIKDEKLHDDLQATVASFKNISSGLEKGEGAAGKLLHDDALYNNLNQTSAEVVKLLYDFRQNPKKYLSIKVSLF
ncbi:MAG TPA: MlaD family protein [Blastocatellia bacterium]|nr:MlaD family protein [Blastocatellia bacterium]